MCIITRFSVKYFVHECLNEIKSYLCSNHNVKCGRLLLFLLLFLMRFFVQNEKTMGRLRVVDLANCKDWRKKIPSALKINKENRSFELVQVNFQFRENQVWKENRDFLANVKCTNTHIFVHQMALFSKSMLWVSLEIAETKLNQTSNGDNDY